MGTGKVFPVTGFSGSFGDTSFSCHYTQKEGSKQQTSKVEHVLDKFFKS